MPRRPLLLALCLLTACDRPSAPAGASATSATSAAPQAPSAPPSASSAASPSSAPAPPAPTSLRVTGIELGLHGSSLDLTVLQTEPDGQTVLLNEFTHDYAVFETRPEGEWLRLTAPGFSFRILLPTEKSAGSLHLPGQTPTLLRFRSDKEPMHAKIGSYPPPPTTSTFVGLDGARIEVTPEDRPRHIFHERQSFANRMALLYKGHWIPSSSSLPHAKVAGIGGQRLRPEPVGPERTAGCLIHGVVPVIEGPLAALVQQTWRGWASERCAAAGADAVVELSYATVVLAGVNLDVCAPGSACTSPSSSVHLPINLMARVSTAAGGHMVEEAFLLDTGAGTLPSLISLLKPTAGALLSPQASEAFGQVAPWMPRQKVTWPIPSPAPGLPPATLTVGPTSIDVVLPPAPLGLFLKWRHLSIGPRSTLAGAFTPTPATQRLTAPLFVAY